MSTIAANIYCAPNDIVDLLSTPGVNQRVDDVPPTTLGGAAAKAGNQIDKFCYQRYEPTYLAQSDLVKDWAATIAAFYLCCRRGNGPPKGIAILYEAALADLAEIKKGIDSIPGIPLRRGYAPVMSVMRATQVPFDRAVVEVSLGANLGGKPNYRQHADAWDRIGINSDAILDNSF